MPLPWPKEQARADAGEPAWMHAGSNICLDFHGDPCRARLAVFSDGNHHMALEEALRVFLAAHPQIGDIFYTTTPPGVLLQLIAHGGLHLGNLFLAIAPQVFISPPHILDRLVQSGAMAGHVPFMQSRGNVLLVRQGNPRHIQGIGDLLRVDVRFFLSNPETEAASYHVYRDTLLGLVRAAGLEVAAFEALLGGGPPRLVHGEAIHHREAPQALASDRADVALVYYHLALRYTRVFPGRFEIVALGGTPQAPQPAPENVLSRFHAGLVGGGGEWGGKLLEFLQGETVTEIYIRHGLQRPG